MATTETTDTTVAKKDDPDRVVDVIVTRYTSLGSQFLAPGLHRMRLLHARHMQAQGLAHPPPKVTNAVLAVPDEAAEENGSEDAEGIDDEDKGDGSEGE